MVIILFGNRTVISNDLQQQPHSNILQMITVYVFVVIVIIISYYVIYY